MTNDVYFENVNDEYLAFRIINYLKHNELYKSIIDRLDSQGYEVFIVGGFIRDFLNTGKFSDDVDFTTNATPYEIRKAFHDKKYASGGETFLVSFVDGVEIATYRKDIKNTGKRSECEVEKTSSIEEDLNRRDFTINAIAFSPITGNFIDLHNGKNDIIDRKINFVGNPADRIIDDNERILRACRFAAVMDGSFEHHTYIELNRYAHLVKNVAPERIGLEIMKAMKVRKASKFFDSMRIIECLGYVLPSLLNCFDKDGGPWHNETIYDHCMEAGDVIHPKNRLVKLTAYLHDVGKAPCAELDDKTRTLKFIGHESEGAELVKKELKDLCFSNNEIKFVSGLISVHMNSFSNQLSMKARRRFLVRLAALGIDYQDWFRLFIADKHANRKSRDFKFGEIRSFLGKLRYIDENEHVFSIKDLDISGFDVMKILDITQGVIVGEVLKNVFNHCLEFPGDNNKEYLLEYIKTLNLTTLVLDVES